MSIEGYVKRTNLFYENIAAYLNELNQLGYTKDELDAPKHIIASAHSIVENGQSITNTLGHLNEWVAAFRNRDNFGEHNKDHRNNIVGMTLGSWLKSSLGRKPTLQEITVAVGTLAEERMIASYRPEGEPNKLSALTSSALASFWGGTIRSSTLQQLAARRERILNQIKQMTDDGRMERLRQFVESGAARNLTFTDKENKMALVELVRGETGNDDGPASDDLHPSPERAVDPETHNQEHGSLPDMVQEDRADHMASLSAVDEDDIYQMAEEVFSSLTLDDWATIPDDNDPFGNRDPFAGGVKWVPGLGPPPSTP